MFSCRTCGRSRHLGRKTMKNPAAGRAGFLGFGEDGSVFDFSKEDVEPSQGFSWNNPKTGSLFVGLLLN